MGVIKRRYRSGKLVWGVLWVDEYGHTQRQFDRTWNRKRAQRAYDELAQRLQGGVATAPQMTVAELFAEWHANHVQVNCSPAYQGDAERCYRLRIGPMIGHRRIDTVNRRMVMQMVAQMRAVMHARQPGNEYAGHATVNKTLTMVKGMFTYAVKIEQLARNPAHGVPELAEEPTRQIDAWPLAVIQRIALEAFHLSDALPDFQRGQRAPWAGQRDLTLILLAALTGLRQSELLGLRWDRIDDHWLHVTHKLCRKSFTLRETKSRRGRRRVPLLPQTRQLLDAWRAVGAHPTIVFPNHDASGFMRGEHFDNKVWQKARRRAGTIDVGTRTYDCARMTFHELRHTFISHCLAAGRDVWEVAHWAGDDPDMIKQVYGHYIPDLLGDTGRLEQTMRMTLQLPSGD